MTSKNSRGALPPKLVLETLLTIHRISFPITEDAKSDSFLTKMVKKRGFDPGAQFIGYVRLDYDRSDIEYEYWGDRLEKLYEVVRDPPPTNALVAWFERHTSEERTHRSHCWLASRRTFWFPWSHCWDSTASCGMAGMEISQRGHVMIEDESAG